jgi:hypothetical protein
MVVQPLSICYFAALADLTFGFLRSQYLCFRLKPVIQGEAINVAALLVQLIGAVADAILDVGSNNSPMRGEHRGHSR